MSEQTFSQGATSKQATAVVEARVRAAMDEGARRRGESELNKTRHGHFPLMTFGR